MAPTDELPTWKKLMRSESYHKEINNWSDGDPRLLAVYYIAEQDYCEWKATYEKDEGRLPDSEIDQRSRQEGREGHRALFESESEPESEKMTHEGVTGVGPTPLGESIGAGEMITTDSQTLVAPLQEFDGPPEAEGDPFYLIGEADNIVFNEGIPKAIVERKFVRDRRREKYSNLEIAYTNERIQGWLYARILDNLGFDISELRVVLLKHHKSLKNDTDHQFEALRRSATDASGERVATNYGPDGTAVMGSDAETVAYVEPYCRDKYSEFLADALSYWRGERGAQGPDTDGKCRGCGFQESCPHSRV
jgi:hypothetical protein